MKLLAQSLVGFVLLFAVMAAVTFGAAGTPAYWQGWALIVIFFTCAGLISVWLWRFDKALLERRVKAGPGSEVDPAQNVIQSLAGVIFLATLAVPGLDQRFGWSHVPAAVVILGDALVVIGFAVVFLVFRENIFTAGTIEVTEGQRVIDTGPYALVRHPMYAGALVMFVGLPLALGSWWGLAPAAAIVPILGWRLLREEAFLAEQLDGYTAYRGRVRFRLAPGLW
jgi:protein-S-isoprenylcysteine O-methyltransferase Ste14